jgi:ubiquinone/menaquinone biosynthesis C-methylase UbiE
MLTNAEAFDPHLYTRQLQQEWDAVADDWGKWWDYVDRAGQPSNERLVTLADVTPGERVLDLGTGIGEPAVTAARRVGPRGRVLAIDLAPRMLEVGRRRAARLGLGNLEFREGDAQMPDDLELGEGPFDAVLSRWTIMLFPDLSGFLARVHGLLAPGGRFAAGLWGPPERVPLIGAAFGAASRLLPLPAPEPGAPSPFWTGGVDGLEQMLRTAGFVEVRSESVPTVFEFPSAETYARFVMTMAGPLKMILDVSPEPVRREVSEAIVEAGRAFARRDGRIRMANETLCVAGERPM